MEREPWTPWLGIQDIFRFVRARACRGALVWAIALFLMLQGGIPFGDVHAVYMTSLTGSLAASLVLTWRLGVKHQWAGVVPYLITTLLILALLVPMTLVAHALWRFSSLHSLDWILGMSALGVLLRGVGSVPWMKDYWRRN